MPLTFLAPLFLVGLVSLVVPILIHLFRRERAAVVEFPSLMFLKRIPYRSVRRQRIRHWLLLLLRCAVLALLALAFARPLLQGGGASAVGITGGREVVILVDHSYSMGYGDRWSRALDAARSEIDGLGPDDRATVVFFSDRAVAADRPTSDPLRLRAALESATLSSRGTRYAPALKLARKLLLESQLPRREVLLVSDFQKVGWGGEDQVRLPLATELRYADLSTPDVSNLSVTSVLLERRTTAGRQRLTVSGRLVNKGADGFDDVALSLEVNGRSLQTLETRIGANDSALVTFEPVTLPDGIAMGTVNAQVDGDRLVADNAFHFVLSPASRFGVLIVEGGRRQGRGSLFLRRALALGEQPSFEVAVRDQTRFQEADLANQRVVVLNDAMPERAGALRRFVEEGGGLLVALGSGVQPGQGRSQAAQLLALPVTSLVDRSVDWGGQLAYLDYSHPIFEVFGAPRSGDFFSAKFFRYHDLTQSSEARVVARFDDAKPALVEYALGGGKVMVWPTTLDRYWNNLPVEPVFLPFVHQLVRHLGGYTASREWYTVGQVADLSAQLASPSPKAGSASGDAGGAAPGSDSRWIVETPGGETTTATLEGRPLFALEEQGFYELRPMTSKEGADDGEGDRPETLSLAANLDFEESDLSTLDAEELASAVSSLENPQSAGPTHAQTPAEREERQRVWWYLLSLVAVLLAIETMLANRLSRRAQTSG